MRSQETSNRKSDAWNMMRLATAERDLHRFHAALQDLNPRDLLAQDYETGNTLLYFALESSYGPTMSFFSLLLEKITRDMPDMLQEVVLLLNTKNETILSLIIKRRPDHLNSVINAIPDNVLGQAALLLNADQETLLSLIIKHCPYYLNRVINAIPDNVLGQAALLLNADQETLLSLIIKHCPDHLNSVITKIPERYLGQAALLIHADQETLLSLIIKRCPDHLNSVIIKMPDFYLGLAALLTHADQETLLSLIIKHCPDHLNRVINAIPDDVRGKAALLIHADQETLLSLIIKHCPDHLNRVINAIPDDVLGVAIRMPAGPQNVPVFYQMEPSSLTFIYGKLDPSLLKELLVMRDENDLLYFNRFIESDTVASVRPLMMEVTDLRDFYSTPYGDTIIFLMLQHCQEAFNNYIKNVSVDFLEEAVQFVHENTGTGCLETLLSLIIKYGVPNQIRMCISRIFTHVLEEALCQMTGPPDRSVSVFYQMADKYPTMIEEIRDRLEPGVLQSVLSLQTYSGNLPFHSLLQGNAFTLVQMLIRMLSSLEIIQLMFWENEQGITPLEEMSIYLRDYPSRPAMRRASSSPVSISSTIDEGPGFEIIDHLIDVLIEVHDENNLPRLFDFIKLAGSSKGSQWVVRINVLRWLGSMEDNHLEKALANLHSGPREMTALDCLAGTFSKRWFSSLIQQLDAGVLGQVFARSERNGAGLLENAMRCSLGLFQAWMQISSDVSYSDVLYVALQTPNDAGNSLFHTWMRNHSLTEEHILALILKFTPAQMGELLLQQNRTGITPLLIAMEYMHTQPLLSLIQAAKMEPSREVLIQLLNYALKKKSSLTKFGNSQQIEEFNEVVLTLMDRGVHLLAVKPSRENSSNGRAFFVEFMHKKLDKIQLALRDCPSVEEFKRTEGTGSCVLLGHLQDIVSTRISESGVSRIATRGGRGFNDALRVLLDKIDRLSLSLGLSSKSALIKEMIDPPAPLSSAIIVEPEVTFLPSAPPAPLSDGIIAVLPKATFLPSAPPAEEEEVEESRESLVGGAFTVPPGPVAILVCSYMLSDDIPMAHAEAEDGEEEKKVNTLSSRSWVSALFSPKKSSVSSEERKAEPAP